MIIHQYTRDVKNQILKIHIDSEPLNHYNIIKSESVNQFGGGNVATSLKRFTISITPSMESSLDKAKRDFYYKDTQNEMIRDLIIRGLETLNRKDEEEKSKNEAV